MRRMGNEGGGEIGVNWRGKKPRLIQGLPPPESLKPTKMLPGCVAWKAFRKEESSGGIKARLVKATRLAAEWVRANRKVAGSKEGEGSEAS